MAVTIKDVAALAGVSTSTVSRVCNGNPSTTRETRERVLKAIAELGYEINPNTPGEAKPAPAPLSIAIVLPPSGRDAYENVFYLKALRGISQVCNQRQVTITIVTGKTFDEVLSTIKTLQTSGRADGYVLLYSKKDDIITDYLCGQGLLYVVVGKVMELSDQTICIDNDNLMAGKDATDYLYRLGHRRIGYLCENKDYFYSEARKSGYQLSLVQNGLPFLPDYCVAIDSIHPDDLGMLHTLLGREDRPTAFVVCDDLLAMALERACSQAGLSIPEDMSIIAFNNSLYVKLSDPQLTAVDINAYQLGYEAAAQLISHIENPDLTATKTIIPHRIIERDSCKKLEA